MDFLNGRTYIIKTIKKDDVNDFLGFIRKINPQTEVSGFEHADCHDVVLTSDKITAKLSTHLVSMEYGIVQQAIEVENVDEIKKIIINNIKRKDIFRLDYDPANVTNIFSKFIEDDISFAYNYCMYLERRFVEIYDKYQAELLVLKNSIEKNSINQSLKDIRRMTLNLEDEFLDLNSTEFDQTNNEIDDNTSVEFIQKFTRSLWNNHRYFRIISIIHCTHKLYTFFDYYYNWYNIISRERFENRKGKDALLENLTPKKAIGDNDNQVRAKMVKAIEIMNPNILKMKNKRQLHVIHDCEAEYEYRFIEKLLKEGYKNVHRCSNQAIRKSVAFTVDLKSKDFWLSNITCMACCVSSGTRPVSSKEILNHYDFLMYTKDITEYKEIAKTIYGYNV